MAQLVPVREFPALSFGDRLLWLMFPTVFLIPCVDMIDCFKLDYKYERFPPYYFWFKFDVILTVHRR